ncbi:hypothetical protein MMC12_000951 [Toensbergia leucococca]|nr:hypothetical protein [Toensbergia leucococca]
MPHTSKKRAYPNLDPHTPSRNPKRPRITEISTPSPITTHRTYFPDSSVQATPASSITLVGSPTFTSTSTSSSAFPNEIYRSHPPHAASELSSPVPSSSSTSSSGSRSDSSSDSSSDSESIPNDPAALNRRWLAAETSASSSESSSESDSDSDSQSGSDSSGSRSESSSSASSDSPNEQSEASSSSSSSSNSGSSSDSDSDSEIDSRSSSAPSPPPPYSVTDPHPRSLLSRLSSLLPTLAAANKTLEVERAEGVLWERDIENLGSEEDGRYIEMDLGLGVLEEKCTRNRSNSSSSIGSSSSSSSETETNPPKERDILGRLMGRGSKPERPEIQVLGGGSKEVDD